MQDIIPLENNNKPLFVPSNFANREEENDLGRFKNDQIPLNIPLSPRNIPKKVGLNNNNRNDYGKSDNRGDSEDNMIFKSFETKRDVGQGLSNYDGKEMNKRELERESGNMIYGNKDTNAVDYGGGGMNIGTLLRNLE